LWESQVRWRFRALLGAAAYQRFLNASATGSEIKYSPDVVLQDFVLETMKVVEPDPDDAMHVDLAIVTSGSLESRLLAEQHTIWLL
jgi:hypothetical protein